MPNATIIGSGTNGLSAVIVLAGAGIAVNVFEPECRPSGPRPMRSRFAAARLVQKPRSRLVLQFQPREIHIASADNGWSASPKIRLTERHIHPFALHAIGGRRMKRSMEVVSLFNYKVFRVHRWSAEATAVMDMMYLRSDMAHHIIRRLVSERSNECH